MSATRYAISSFEENWVKICHKFFEEYGEFDWINQTPEEAFVFMINNSTGNFSPMALKLRITELYESVGYKNDADR